jgi:hypothetical protein
MKKDLAEILRIRPSNFGAEVQDQPTFRVWTLALNTLIKLFITLGTGTKK